MRYGKHARCEDMPSTQEQYDDAMYEFSTGNFDAAVAKLKDLLAQVPDDFDAQLSLGMAYYRKGDYRTAIEEGLKAEQLNPKEQLVHTNLSLFYLKAGDKTKAEHHGLQARIASWRTDAGADRSSSSDTSVEQAKPAVSGPPPKLPDMPWKNKPAAAKASSSTEPKKDSK